MILGALYTPTEGVSHVTVEELVNAVSRMSGLCLTPKLEPSPEGRSASRLPSGVKRRILFPRKEQEHLKWLDKEVHAFILFLLFHTDGKSWVTHKHEKFWEDAACFVQLHSQPANQRTG